MAVIDAYNNPTAAKDLETYSAEFGLTPCTVESGCFKQVNEEGQAGPLPFPESVKEREEWAASGETSKNREGNEAIGWDIEIALDIEAVRATCPNCRILLVEAESPSYADLEEAVSTAEALGAKVITNSWGGEEVGPGATVEGESKGPFNKPGTVITASSGDSGYRDWDSEGPLFTSFPASSPHVVAVGGTLLRLLSGAWTEETVWNSSGASGGGCSSRFTAPAWQQAVKEWFAVGCETKRSVADVAADADPHSGIAVTATNPMCEFEVPVGSKHRWCTYEAPASHRRSSPACSASPAARTASPIRP